MHCSDPKPGIRREASWMQRVPCVDRARFRRAHSPYVRAPFFGSSRADGSPGSSKPVSHCARRGHNRC